MGQGSSTCSRCRLSEERRGKEPIASQQARTEAAEPSRSILVKRCFYDKENGKLEEKTYRKPYKCDGCLMKGIGIGCRCTECDYVLHMECMYPSYDNLRPCVFPSDSDVSFKFFEKPPGGHCNNKIPHNCPGNHDERYCDACGKLVEGFVYHCEKKDLDLHPRCANLGPKFTIEKYLMEFTLRKDQKQKKCNLCRSKVVQGGDPGIRGWFYAYVDQDKEYNLHVFCIMDIAIKSCEAAKVDGDFKKALENQLKKDLHNGGRLGRSDTSVEILTLVVTTILSIFVFGGDPTQTAAKLIVVGGIKFVEFLMQLLSK